MHEMWRLFIIIVLFASMNPEVDVGQVEGAVVMGLGYWLMEDYIYDETTGQALTHNTWVRPVGSCKCYCWVVVVILVYGLSVTVCLSPTSFCIAPSYLFNTKNYWKIEKEIVREVARGDKPYQKIYRSQSTNQEGVRSAHRTDLCFAICRSSQVRFITPSHLTHNLFFYFQ